MSIYYVILTLCSLLTSLTAASGKQSNIRQHQQSQEDQQAYFQYLNSPAFLQYEFGFNRGSPTHQISRHEQFKNGNFHSKVEWSDSYEGIGSHYFDYNHGSSSAEYTAAPEYHTPSFIKPAYDSKPAATHDITQDTTQQQQQQPIFDTLFRFPKPNNA